MSAVVYAIHADAMLFFAFMITLFASDTLMMPAAFTYLMKRLISSPRHASFAPPAIS